jgi:hypothetical protein
MVLKNYFKYWSMKSRKKKYQFKELEKKTQRRMTNKNIRDNWSHFKTIKQFYKKKKRTKPKL